MKNKKVTQNLGGSTSVPTQGSASFRPLCLWGGFTDGRLHIESVNDHWGGVNERHAPALFLTYAEARKQYQDVRKVKICPVEPRRNS